jgi:flagellar biogenesis protein FliO
MFEKIIYALGLLLILALVFYLAYLTTRYIGSKAETTGKYSRKRHLRIIEVMCLGRDKYLYLIKAGNEYMLISSSNKGIEMLGNIDIDWDTDSVTEKDYAGKAHAPGSFKEIFGNYLSHTFSWYGRKKTDEEQSHNAKKGN